MRVRDRELTPLVMSGGEFFCAVAAEVMIMGAGFTG